MNRCTGHCCRSFYLPLSPSELAEATRFIRECEGYELRLTQLRGSPDLDYATTEEQAVLGPDPRWGEDANGHRRYEQGLLQIADMVEYLGYMPPPYPLVDGVPDPQKSSHYYRCRNLQPDGNCGIYATRPRMCRDYPYGRRCSYAQCTWDKAKEEGCGG